MHNFDKPDYRSDISLLRNQQLSNMKNVKIDTHIYVIR